MIEANESRFINLMPKQWGPLSFKMSAWVVTMSALSATWKSSFQPTESPLTQQFRVKGCYGYTLCFTVKQSEPGWILLRWWCIFLPFI